MRQASLKFRGFAHSLQIINNNNIRRQTLSIIFASLGVLSICYAFFLGSMVLNIVERKNLEAEARVIASDIGALELTYFSKSNIVDLSLSSTMGFKEAKANFATRKSLGSLKIAKHEI